MFLPVNSRIILKKDLHEVDQPDTWLNDFEYDKPAFISSETMIAYL